MPLSIAHYCIITFWRLMPDIVISHRRCKLYKNYRLASSVAPHYFISIGGSDASRLASKIDAFVARSGAASYDMPQHVKINRAKRRRSKFDERRYIIVKCNMPERCHGTVLRHHLMNYDEVSNGMAR